MKKIIPILFLCLLFGCNHTNKKNVIHINIDNYSKFHSDRLNSSLRNDSLVIEITQKQRDSLKYKKDSSWITRHKYLYLL